jgi:fluoroquinolone resistance protein
MNSGIQLSLMCMTRPCVYWAFCTNRVHKKGLAFRSPVIFEVMEDAGPVVHQDKSFDNVNYSGKRLENREFLNCRFTNCDFSKSDLSGNDFINCHFSQCNFSLARMEGTGFRDAAFVGCKILGVDFTRCNKFMFSFSFQQCYLDYCIFLGTKLKKINFSDCSLKEVDFSEADLMEASFKDCDLADAKFSNTNLQKTDFRTARNFAIDPAFNKMKKARFSSINLSGLLYQYNLDIDHENY